MEPVEGAPVQEGREAAGSHPEGIPNRGEAEHDPQFGPGLLQEVVEAVLLRVHDKRFPDLVADAADDGLELLRSKQVRDLSVGQQVIEVHQNPLVEDLRITEQENGIHPPGPRAEVQLLEILPERRQVVVWVQPDRVHTASTDVGREAGQRLLATTAHAHEQRISWLGVEDAADPANVANCVIEWDDVHMWERVIVLGDALLQHHA
mmetsp:Transcript_148389/g.259348  ORF Transcript_148389/g.259348 Transcript_148389/m.259348 type:complete len:206 (+) Transcript_148389:498-1115(+)